MLKILKTIFSNYNINKKDIYLVDPYRDKDFLIDSIEKEKILGIDTEFDWRNTYFPKLSLLQIATKSRILLIDCLKSESLDFLKQLLEDENKLIIFHSSRSDTTVLYTNLNIKVENIYDIQIGEKYISEGDSKNYAALVNKYFCINLKKTETNSNWLKRPFSKEQLNYAADDVNFLLEIYTKQKKVLKKNNLLNLALSESIKESKLGNQELHISRIKKLKKLSKAEKNIFLWREKHARKLNIPTSYIFKNKNLKKLVHLSQSKEINQEEIIKYFNNNNFVKDFVDFIDN